MGPWSLAAGLALVAHAAPPPALRPDATASFDTPSLTLRAPGADLSREQGPPSCSGEVCQPRVAVPGQDPRFSTRGRRTDLALSMLQRTRIDPVVAMARLLAVTGLRLDYSPAHLDPGRGLARNGWGEVMFGVRWRLDAANRPEWATPPPR
jgi:hypothetical protein